MTPKIMDELNRSYQSVFNHSFTESMTKYGGEQRSDSMTYKHVQKSVVTQILLEEYMGFHYITYFLQNYKSDNVYRFGI